LLFVGSARVRLVAHSSTISRSTVKEYQRRAKKAGTGWPEIESFIEEGIE
jgi:hypothetical protein